MITTTLGALVTAEAALRRLGAARLPVKAAYHVAKLLRLVLAETQHFHEQHHADVTELGEPLEGQPDARRVAPAHLPEFARRMEELAAIAVSVPWEPIDLSGLTLDISADDILALGPLVALPNPAETAEGKSI